LLKLVSAVRRIECVEAPLILTRLHWRGDKEG